MPVNVSVTVKGAADVSRAFQRVIGAAGASTLLEALFEAAEPVVERATSTAPEGALRDGLKVKGTETGPNSAVVDVTVSKLGILFELGTGPRTQKTTGRRTGSMPAQPFLRRALDSEAERSAQIFGEHVKKAIIDKAGAK